MVHQLILQESRFLVQSSEDLSEDLTEELREDFDYTLPIRHRGVRGLVVKWKAVCLDVQ